MEYAQLRVSAKLPPSSTTDSTILAKRLNATNSFPGWWRSPPGRERRAGRSSDDDRHLDGGGIPVGDEGRLDVLQAELVSEEGTHLHRVRFEQPQRLPEFVLVDHRPQDGHFSPDDREERDR